MSIIENHEKTAYLRRYRDAATEVARLEGELARWRSLAERVTPSRSQSTAHSAGEDKLQQAVERIVDLEQQLAAQLQQQIALRQEIGAVIAGVQDARLRQLLKLRYIEGLVCERVAESMDISSRWVRELHNQAMIFVDDFLVVPLFLV